MKATAKLLAWAAVLLLVLPGCLKIGKTGKDGGASVPVTAAQSVSENVPEAALGYAEDWVHSLTSALADAGCPVTAAEITGLTMMNTGTAGLWDSVNMYELAYAVTPADPAKVPEGAVFDADGRIVGAESYGAPYLLLYGYDFEDDGADGITWQRMTVLHAADIERDYNTPDMLEKYGNPYTAACMNVLDRMRQTGELPRHDP